MSKKRYPLDDAAVDLARRTRREQGLPPKVRDPAVLARIAALLAPAAGGGKRRAAS